MEARKQKELDIERLSQEFNTCDRYQNISLIEHNKIDFFYLSAFR